MASTCDDFLINFDLNQFGIEDSAETVKPNYERLRKNTHLLKKKIISTDFVVQRYLAKTEDYNQALKAHALTKEELKQACINYKNTSDRCSQLEQDIKLSQASQEALQQRVSLAETKYDALISYSNQMQALVQQLKTENEALVIEKKLDGNSSSRILQLKKEKETLRKNILALKDVVLGKKKKDKRHLRILKAYSDPKDSNVYTSDESADEKEELSYSKIKSHKINDKPVTLNVEPDFIDNDSDSCNEEISIDTGRGSSRANSDKNDLNSPEYFNFESSPNPSDHVLVKQINVATSPITVHKSVSVSTSPIAFDRSVSLFVDDDTIRQSNNTCTESAVMKENNELVDSCTSPISMIELQKVIDVGTSPVQELNNIIIKDVKKYIPKSLFSDPDESSKPKQNVLEEKLLTCSCQKAKVMMVKNKLIDVCTSPISELSHLCFLEKSTTEKSFDHEIDHEGCHENSEQHSPFNYEYEEELNNFQSHAIKSYSNKFTITESAKVTENNVVDACTSPVLNMITAKSDNIQAYEQDETSFDVSECEGDIHKENSFQVELPYKESSVTTEPILKRVIENEKLIHVISSQEFNIRKEKICLENNNSMNIGYNTKDDDVEVQNILSKMKFHRSLISPLPNTPPNLPFDSNYLNMHIKNIYELIEKCNNNIKVVHNDVEEIKKRDTVNLVTESLRDSVTTIAETDSNDRQETEEQQSITTNEKLNQENAEEDEEEEYISDIIVLSNAENCNIPNECENINISEGCSYQVTQDMTHNNNSETLPNITVEVCEMDEMVPLNGAKTQKNSYQKQIRDKESLEDVTDETVNISLDNNSKTDRQKIYKSKKSALKTKTKSKLQKLRDRMLPISKIKKVVPITPKVSKVRKNIPTQSNSPLDKQRIAFEKAVKVMNDLKLKQKLETKPNVTLSTNTESEIPDNVNKIESLPFNSHIITTRSRTLRSSKEVDKTTVTVSPKNTTVLEKTSSEAEKSPSNRYARKRVADNDIDHLQGSRKRTLRSANNNIIFSTIQIEIEPYDDDESKMGVKELDNLVKSDNIFLSDDQRYEGNSIDEFDESDEKQDKKILTQNAHNETTTSRKKSNVLINKEDTKNMENPNVNQCKKSSMGKESTHIAESFNDSNSNKSEQVQENDATKNIENHGALQKDLKQNSIQNGANLIQRSPLKIPVVELTSLGSDVIDSSKKKLVNYGEIDLYSADHSREKTAHNVIRETPHIKENILCAALEKHGVNKVKYTAKKMPELVNTISQKIEDSITEIIGSPKDQQKNKMNQLIHSIQSFKTKQIVAGLMKYLKDPTRKCELFNTISHGSAPPMTKSEVILLYVIEHINVFIFSGNFIQNIYANIEHALFQLNQSPDFQTIESMSHFYAVMCRYFRNKSRLRCFMLDAMYCLQFKAVPLIKQCLDVCPGVLPYSHEHMAKTSLVTCLVYLLHFYKCTDKNNRVQEIRNTLSRKYHYRFSEWNETMILEIFRKAIMNLRDMHNDKKMLRVALIILCKRHGAHWCQTKIIQNMLMPIIQQPAVPEKIKQFCVLMLGPLLKPFPADKKAQCEIVINQLMQLLTQNPSHDMQEAIYSSLIFMSKHDQERVVQALLSWNPGKVSKDFEEILNDYVMDRPLSLWKKLVTIPSQCS